MKEEFVNPKSPRAPGGLGTDPMALSKSIHFPGISFSSCTIQVLHPFILEVQANIGSL